TPFARRSFISMLLLVPGFVSYGLLLGQALEQGPAFHKGEPKQVDSKPAFIQDEKTMVWYLAMALQLEGKGWAESGYGRLPSRAKGVVRDPVWGTLTGFGRSMRTIFNGCQNHLSALDIAFPTASHGSHASHRRQRAGPLRTGKQQMELACRWPADTVSNE